MDAHTIDAAEGGRREAGMAMSPAEQQEMSRKRYEVQRAANRAIAETGDAEERRDKARRAVEQAKVAEHNSRMDALPYRMCPWRAGTSVAVGTNARCLRASCAFYNRGYDAANGQSVCGIAHWMGIDADDIAAAEAGALDLPDRSSGAADAKARDASKLERAERELEKAEADLAGKREAERAARAEAEALGVKVGVADSDGLKLETR